jgi:DNA-directed RNA polymerase subunit RPC12/RpoP
MKKNIDAADIVIPPIKETKFEFVKIEGKDGVYCPNCMIRMKVKYAKDISAKPPLDIAILGCERCGKVVEVPTYEEEKDEKANRS